MRRVLPLWLALAAVYAAVALLLDPALTGAQDPLLLGGEAQRPVVVASAALAFALAAALARQWVPDPWATRGAVIGALSPYGFALAADTAAPPAALLVAGTLLALRVRDHPTAGRALGGAGCLALAPWFGLAYAFPAAPPFFALVYWTFRRGRRLQAFLALEIGGATVVALVGATASERSSAPIDPDWAGAAPLVALALLAAYLFVHSRREKLSRAIPARRDAEVALVLCALALGGLALAVAIGEIGPEAGIPLVAAIGAWGLRHFPRAGLALGLLAVGLGVESVV